MPAVETGRALCVQVHGICARVELAVPYDASDPEMDLAATSVDRSFV